MNAEPEHTQAHNRDRQEPRICSETGPAQHIANVAEPVIEDMGYRLVRVQLSGQHGTTVQVMIERPDGTLEISDCVAVTRVLSPLLDVEDPLPGGYHLEVSSPGIDRPLARPGDFERWAGYEAKIEVRELLAGRKRFRGLIEGFADGEVRLEMEIEGLDDTQIVGIPFDLIHSAKLVMNDDLLKRAAPAPKSSAGATQ
ncbi:MAG: ribosome maturation factor RimP [Rhizobiales bacterium]|nr:ribosome maturation factor RimP [Hyphomicrobiales bacterium]